MSRRFIFRRAATQTEQKVLCVIAGYCRYAAKSLFCTTMIPFVLMMIVLTIIQCVGIMAAVRVMKARHLKATDRWIASLVIFMIPLAGMFLYQAFSSFMREKEYCFFSERFREWNNI